MSAYQHLLKKFRAEFGHLESKFYILELSGFDNIVNDTRFEVTSPGVYVWLGECGVIKVGKSQKNSRKRALEHIRDNTANEKIQMKSLSTANGVSLVLFNLHTCADMHWVLALEYYLEMCCEPAIRSVRSG